jgi:hypothetical protein
MLSKKTLTMGLREAEDFFGRRVMIVKGKYKCRKGLVSIYSQFGMYVDLDYNGLRIKVEPNILIPLLDNGEIDNCQK